MNSVSPSKKPTFEVSQITTKDEMRAMTEACYASFVGTSNALFDVLCPHSTPPTTRDIDGRTDRYWQASLSSKPQHEVWFVQILDPETQGIMGAAKWTLHEVDPERPASIPVTWYEQDADPKDVEFAQIVFDEFQARRYNLMKGPHALLDLCFANSSFERRGVATQLVQWGLNRAAELGIKKAFTEGSPHGMPVYRRMGFEIKEAVRLKWPEYPHKPDIVWYHQERNEQ